MAINSSVQPFYENKCPDFWISNSMESELGAGAGAALASMVLSNTLATKQWIGNKDDTKKRLTRWRSRLKFMWSHCNHSKQTTEKMTREVVEE